MRRGIDAPHMHGNIEIFCCRNDALRQRRIVGHGEIDMAHRRARAVEKGRLAPPGVVQDLIGNDQVARIEIGTDAAHRGHRNDAADARLLQRPDVGAIIDGVRRNGMAIAMARQEYRRVAADLAKHQGAGRFSEGCTHHFTVRYVEIGQRGQAAAADDCEHENNSA